MNALEEVHILALTPKEQLIIRVLLSNLMSGYLDLSVQEVAMSYNEEDVTAKSKKVQIMFNRYNSCLDLLCPESMLARAKSKVILLKPTMMKYLLAGFMGYDKKENFLSQEHRDLVDSGFDHLSKKVVESGGFTYNKFEIERAKNSK